MPQYKVLKSVAHNVGHRFTSLLNHAGDDYVMGHVLRFARQTGHQTLRIDLVTRQGEPPELLSEPISELPSRYAHFFWHLVKTQGSDPSFVKAATLTLRYDIGTQRSVRSAPRFVESPYTAMCWPPTLAGRTTPRILMAGGILNPSGGESPVSTLPTFLPTLARRPPQRRATRPQRLSRQRRVSPMARRPGQLHADAWVEFADCCLTTWLPRPEPQGNLQRRIKWCAQRGRRPGPRCQPRRATHASPLPGAMTVLMAAPIVVPPDDQMKRHDHRATAGYTATTVLVLIVVFSAIAVLAAQFRSR